MPTRPTLQEIEAAYERASDTLQTAHAAYEVAVAERQDAQRTMNAAVKALREAREREAKNAIARDRRKAKALAEQWRIKIDWDPYSNVPGDGVWWVLGPQNVYGEGDGIAALPNQPVRADPCEGDHTAISWSEVLNNVSTYVDDLLKARAEGHPALRDRD